MSREPEEIYRVIGRRIKELRNRKGLTQEKLSELSDLSVAFVGQVERGHNRASLVTIDKIADALQIEVSDLFSTVKFETKRTYGLPEKIALLLQNCPPSKKHDVEKMILMFLNKKR